MAPNHAPADDAADTTDEPIRQVTTLLSRTVWVFQGEDLNDAGEAFICAPEEETVDLEEAA